MDRRCSTCRWWDTSVSHGRYQEFSPCRVRPPVVGLGSNQAIWPMVEGDDWCGAHCADEPEFAEVEPASAPPIALKDPANCFECGKPPSDCDCIPF